MKRLCSIVGAVLMAVAVYAGQQGRSSAPQPRVMGLPDCQGNSVFQPKRVTIACGDGNFFVESLGWTGWGASFAAGVGTGKMNDCQPNCAAGHFGNYPVVLIVSGKQTCPNGQPAYEKVTYAFVGRSPFPQNAHGTAGPTRDFPCRATP
jgi:hypothetical protein